MFKNKKRIGIVILVLMIVLVAAVGVITVVTPMDHDNPNEYLNDDVSSATHTQQDESKNKESEPVATIENDLIPGVEYYAPERDIDGVTSNRFSFFIGNDHKILTYINEDEESKIKVVLHEFHENSVSVAFDVNKFDVVVSDDNYYYDGECMNYADKTLVAEENGMKYYTAPYKYGSYVHYFETVIDGMPVSFYASNKSSKNDDLFDSVQELASKLSVNDTVGLWADSRIYAFDGIALKSAKLFSFLSNDSEDRILIGDYEITVMFSMYSWKGTEVNNSNVVLGEIAGQKYGYYTYQDIHGNTDVFVHIYNSEVLGDTEYYTNMPTIFMMENLNETDLTAEQFANMVMEQVIELQE